MLVMAQATHAAEASSHLLELGGFAAALAGVVGSFLAYLKWAQTQNREERESHGKTCSQERESLRAEAAQERREFAAAIERHSEKFVAAIDGIANEVRGKK